MARRRQARINSERPQRPAWLQRLPLIGALLAVLVVVAATATWLVDPEHLPLRTVRVEGELQHVTSIEVRQAVRPFATAGFLRVDIGAVRTALEDLPWVYSAQVRREWPDVLLVQLKEQRVLARWADGALVNPVGALFRPKDAVATDALPLLQGPEGTSVMLASHFIELQQELTPLALTITQVTMDERRAWRVKLDNGVELMLGRSDHPARMERFLRAYPHILQPRVATVARVDLRYTNGFAVQWREPSHAGA